MLELIGEPVLVNGLPLAPKMLSVHGKEIIKRDLGWLPFPSDFDWSLQPTRDGSLVTRIAKRYKEFHEQNLWAETKSHIGNIISRYSQTFPDSLYMDVTDKFDWEAGDFGDHGSCFWTNRSNAIDMLYGLGALAVRFYMREEDEYSIKVQGIGRAWCVPVQEQLGQEWGWAIFNAYGNLGSVQSSPEIVSTLLRNHYGVGGVHRTELYYQGAYDGTLYINKGTGYLWTPILCGVDDLDLFPIPDGHMQCWECHQYFHMDDMECFDNHEYCEHCMRNNFYWCSMGEHWTYPGDHVYRNHDYICYGCAEQLDEEEQEHEEQLVAREAVYTTAR